MSAIRARRAATPSTRSSRSTRRALWTSARRRCARRRPVPSPTYFPVQADHEAYQGGMDEHTYAIDRFIIGGPATGSYLDAMRRAATLWLPLKRVYAKNGTLGGVVHGCKVTGATWQSLPLGD